MAARACLLTVGRQVEISVASRLRTVANGGLATTGRKDVIMRIARARRTLLLCIVLAVVWTPGIAADGGVPSGAPERSSAVAKPKRPRFAVRSLRAYLYYHARGPLEDVRGRFDDADILTGKVALWNVLGGGGDAQAPSSAILVLVD